MGEKSKREGGGAGGMELGGKGEVEIGLTFMSEMGDPGIDIVGPLPREISPPTILGGFVSTHAKDPAAAKALLNYLSSPEAAAGYKAQGMEPGRWVVSTPASAPLSPVIGSSVVIAHLV